MPEDSSHYYSATSLSSVDSPPSPRLKGTASKLVSRDLTAAFFPTLHQTTKSRQPLQLQPGAAPTSTSASANSSTSLLPGFSSADSSSASTTTSWDNDTVPSYNPTFSRLGSTSHKQSPASLLSNSTSLPHLASYSNGHITSSLGRHRSLYSRGRSSSPSASIARQPQHHLSSPPPTLSPSRSPRQLHPHEMADFDDEPVVPRSSKQAKMLGVGVDLDPAGSKGMAGRTGRNGFGDASSEAGLESWNGWGAKVGNGAVGDGSSSPRLDNGSVRVIAPWGQSASTSNDVSASGAVPLQSGN